MHGAVVTFGEIARTRGSSNQQKEYFLVVPLIELLSYPEDESDSGSGPAILHFTIKNPKNSPTTALYRFGFGVPKWP
jgi:hypothetical protein